MSIVIEKLLPDEVEHVGHYGEPHLGGSSVSHVPPHELVHLELRAARVRVGVRRVITVPPISGLPAKYQPVFFDVGAVFHLVYEPEFADGALVTGHFPSTELELSWLAVLDQQQPLGARIFDQWPLAYRWTGDPVEPELVEGARPDCWLDCRGTYGLHRVCEALGWTYAR